MKVLIGQKKKGRLRFVGVGVAQPTITGLRQRLFKMLRMLHVYTFCPFVGFHDISSRNVPAVMEKEVAECQWVEASVKVWVEFDGWDDNGHLVSPRVVDCTQS